MSVLFSCNDKNIIIIKKYSMFINLDIHRVFSFFKLPY